MSIDLDRLAKKAEIFAMLSGGILMLTVVGAVLFFVFQNQIDRSYMP